jgi:hypothetical protein
VAFAVGSTTVSWSDDFNQAGQSIAPGEEISLTAVGGPGGKATWTATQGTFTVQAWVNDTENILESDYTNNKTTAEIVVNTSEIQQIGAGTVYAAGKSLHVKDYPAGSSVAVYDVQGQVLTVQTITVNDHAIRLTTGSYIIQVKVNEKTDIYKVLVP